MALFSNNPSSKISIHDSNTESSDPVMTDIVDLRKLRPKSKLASSSKEESKEPLKTEAKPAPKTAPREFKEPRIVSRYFQDQPPVPPKSSWRSIDGKRWLLYVVTPIIIIVGGLWLLSTYFASATIVVQPQKEETSLSKIAVIIDPTLSLPDLDSRRIPGEAMQYSDEISMSFKATGQKYIEAKAKGIITISNAFSSSPQTLVQSTRFQETKTGKIYRLTKSITIPGAKIEDGKIIPSTIDAEIAADIVGDDSNLAEGMFVIPGFQGTPKFKAFTAVTKEKIVGGFKGTSQVVTKEDLDKANAAFQKEALARLRAKSNQNILPGFTAISAAEKFETVIKNTPSVNDPAETFIVSGIAKLSNIAFQPKTLLELLGQVIYKDSYHEKIVLTEKSKLNFDAATIDTNSKLHVNISGTLVAAGTIQITSLQNDLAGKSAEAAANILRTFPGVGAFGIKIFPFWKSSIPSAPDQITIEIQKAS